MQSTNQYFKIARLGIDQEEVLMMLWDGCETTSSAAK